MPLSRRSFLRLSAATATTLSAASFARAFNIVRASPIPVDPNYGTLTYNVIQHTPLRDFYAMKFQREAANYTRFCLDLSDVSAQEMFRTVVSANNPTGGALIANLRMRGSRLRFDPSSPTNFLVLHSATGEVTSIPHSMFDHPDTQMITAIDGEPVPPYLARSVWLFVPGVYDYKIPPLLDEWTFSRFPIYGEWEQRGWSYTGTIRTFSTIHTPVDSARVVAGARIFIQGIAYAGTRDITRIEVQIDGGAWIPARIVPPANPHSWAQWYRVHTFDRPGIHTIRVRATDSDGFTQFRDVCDAYPNGTDAIHAVTIEAV